MSNKQKDERKYAHERFLAIVDFISRAYAQTVKWGALVACAFFAYKSIDSLSGRDTFVQLALSLVANLKVNKWIYLIAAGCATWALGERRLRRKRTKALHRRNKELEKLIHPNRTSSSLPAGGETRPEDKI
jgi:hypothetical protein